MGVVLPIHDALAARVQRDPPADLTLRDAMARLASGLTLISCWSDGAPKGLVATSLIGLSVAPPRLLFSVRHEASAHDALLTGGRCAAVVLSESDLPEARRFTVSDTQGDRFASPAWRLDDAFAPRFQGGLARFDLAIEHRIGADSHTIFIAEVLDVETHAGAPLVYFDRSFAGLAPGAGAS